MNHSSLNLYVTDERSTKKHMSHWELHGLSFYGIDYAIFLVEKAYNIGPVAPKLLGG